MAEANVAENVDNSQDWGNEPLIPVHELGPEDVSCNNLYYNILYIIVP